jgi:ABC-2 type transport system permease protein
LPAFRIALRLRLPAAVSAAFGLIAVQLAVGALFPAIGHSIGKLNIPTGVAQLLGGADYGTITGWFRSEIGSVYGPLVIGALAIAGACATTAGEEEDRILALVLAQPITRPRLVAAKAAAIAAVVVIIAIGAWAGMIFGVALGGGGVTLGHITALALMLACFGFATGGLALALAAATGSRSLSVAVAAGIAILGWLINGFAPLVSGLSWLTYFSFFHYYAGHDPLTQGVDVVDAAVLVGLTLVLSVVAMAAFDRRDLRA